MPISYRERVAHLRAEAADDLADDLEQLRAALTEAHDGWVMPIALLEEREQQRLGYAAAELEQLRGRLVGIEASLAAQSGHGDVLGYVDAIRDRARALADDLASFTETVDEDVSELRSQLTETALELLEHVRQASSAADDEDDTYAASLDAVASAQSSDGVLEIVLLAQAVDSMRRAGQQ